jgi:CubicO group peptidase (beta-lactamase class C family)
MKYFRFSRFSLAFGLFAMLGAAPAANAGLLDDLPIGTGYSAWELCTRVLHSGDELSRVQPNYLAPKVSPLPYLWRVDVAEQQVEVKTWVPFLSDTRAAVLRPGLGCTLVPPGVTVEEIRNQPFAPLELPPATQAAWPLGEGEAEYASLATDRAALLQRLGDNVFSDPSDTPAERQNTIAFLVAHEGRLIYERYAAGYHREQPQLGWSMTKSVTALLAAAMATDGMLRFDEPVGLPQWEGTPKAKITWKQLLNMAPGLQWDEGYGGASDATLMLFSTADQGQWAADLPLVDEPGTKFVYSTGFSNIAMLRLKQLHGSHQALYDYYQKRLFLPLGIRNGVIEPDASGTPVAGSRGVLRPVDWLRLGQLVAQRGQWNGEQLIAPELTDFLVAPSPASKEYGGMIWLHGWADIPADLRPRLPEDIAMFLGHMGQRVIVVPSRNLVIVRLGASFDSERERRTTLSAVADLVVALDATQ